VIKVLFYAESVGVVTSGHMIKMAVKPFDPPWPKKPYYTQTARQVGSGTRDLSMVESPPQYDKNMLAYFFIGHGVDFSNTV